MNIEKSYKNMKKKSSEGDSIHQPSTQTHKLNFFKKMYLYPWIDHQTNQYHCRLTRRHYFVFVVGVCVCVCV